MIRLFCRIILTVIIIPCFIVVTPILWMMTKSMNNSNDGLFIGYESIKEIWQNK